MSAASTAEAARQLPEAIRLRGVQVRAGGLGAAALSPPRGARHVAMPHLLDDRERALRLSCAVRDDFRDGPYPIDLSQAGLKSGPR